MFGPPAPVWNACDGDGNNCFCQARTVQGVCAKCGYQGDVHQKSYACPCCFVLYLNAKGWAMCTGTACEYKFNQCDYQRNLQQKAVAQQAQKTAHVLSTFTGTTQATSSGYPAQLVTTVRNCCDTGTSANF